MKVPEALPPLPILSSTADLEATCLAPRSGNCILVLLPTSTDPDAVSEPATSALAALAEILDKHNKRKAHIMQMYAVPSDNQGATTIRQQLELQPEGQLEIIALNMKRSWWRHYQTEAYDTLSLENFIDNIKLGEGLKSKLPQTFGTAPQQASEPVPEPGSEPQVEKESGHDEL
jgi:protein disulfide-isomerase A6